MLGAFTLLLLFLAIHEPARRAVESLLDTATSRLAVEAPLSYVLVVIILTSATVSALIMALWPPSGGGSTYYRVMRRYLAPDSLRGETEREVAASTLRLMASPRRLLAQFVAASITAAKRFGGRQGFTTWKRLFS